MKKFLALNFRLPKNPFKEELNPFSFWKITIGLFLGGLVLTMIFHTFIFCWLKSRIEKEMDVKTKEVLFDRELLPKTYRKIKLKEEYFSRYFDEKPELKDPS